MNKVKSTLIFTMFFVLFFGVIYLKTEVDILKEGNAYMVEQVKKLDESLLAVEDILADQTTINDEVANGLANYAQNVQAVNELLDVMKEKYEVE